MSRSETPVIIDMPSPRPVAPAVSATAPGWMHSLQLWTLIGAVIWAPLAFGSTEPWSQFVLRSGAALLLLLWIAERVLDKSESALAPLFLPLAAFVVLVCYQYFAGVSVYPAATMSELLNVFSYAVGAVIAGSLFSRRRDLRVLVTSMSVFGFALALASILIGFVNRQEIYGWREVTSKSAAIYGPYANHNHYAGLMEMLIPLAAAAAVLSIGAKRWILTFAALIMAVSVAFSGSRGGLLSLAVGLLFVCGVLLKTQRSRRGLVVVIALLAICVSMVLMLGTDTILKRLAEKPDVYRLQMYKDSLRIFLERPILGFGLGTFETVYPAYQSFWIDLRVNHAHNDYLELLAETGIVGFAIAGWMMVVVFRTGVNKVREHVDTEGRIMTLGAMTGIFCLLVHSALDFNLHIPANAFMFFVLCGAVATPFKHKIRPLGMAHWSVEEDVGSENV